MRTNRQYALRTLLALAWLAGPLVSAPLAAPVPAAPAPSDPATTSRPDQETTRDRRVDQRVERRSARSARSVQEATETKVFKVDRDTALSISNLSGTITVVPAAEGEVRVQVVRRAYGDTDEEARQQLQRSEVKMEQRGGRLDLQALYGGSHRRLEVAFSVSAPPSVSLDVRSLAGDLSVQGIKGEARLETLSGDIKVRELGALASAKTMSGNIELTGCSAQNEMTVNSVSGDVVATGLKARSCSIGAISGDVDLQQAACERAVGRSVSGDLRYAGSLARGGRYEFKSHSGDVQLAVDGQTGFELDARTFSGTLHSDLPVTVQSAEKEKAGTHAERGQSIRGVFGDGSAQIEVTTFSGDLTITKK